jgi:hypothetical protein
MPEILKLASGISNMYEVKDKGLILGMIKIFY